MVFKLLSWLGTAIVTFFIVAGIKVAYDVPIVKSSVDPMTQSVVEHTKTSLGLKKVLKEEEEDETVYEYTVDRVKELPSGFFNLYTYIGGVTLKTIAGFLINPLTITIVVIYFAIRRFKDINVFLAFLRLKFNLGNEND